MNSSSITHHDASMTGHSGWMSLACPCCNSDNLEHAPQEGVDFIEDHFGWPKPDDKNYEATVLARCVCTGCSALLTFYTQTFRQTLRTCVASTKLVAK